jgi:hypothetical protein
VAKGWRAAGLGACHTTCAPARLTSVCCHTHDAAAAGALAALQAKRDGLHRRCEGLLKCKNEFAELARAL